MMFKDEYENAYNQIKPDTNSIDKIFNRVQDKKICKIKAKRFRPVFVALIGMICLILGVNIPIFAEEVVVSLELAEIFEDTKYKNYKDYKEMYPGWNDAFRPDNATVSKGDVIVTVEAVTTYANQFEAILSFSNEDGSEFINGEDEYDWMNFKTKIGTEEPWDDEVEILKYDETKDKLYVLYTVQRNTGRDIEEEEISISILKMTVSESIVEEFDLSNVETEAETRTVVLPQKKFESDVVKTESQNYPYKVNVLDMIPLSDIQTDEVRVTGIAYIDGILRIQVCYGSTEVPYYDADRWAHLFQYLDSGEREFLPDEDEQIVWCDQVDGKLVEFREFYYVMSEEEVRELVLPIEYYEEEGYMDTIWEINFIGE